MKKFTPNIVIYNVGIYDKKTYFPLANYYFLSYKRANKFLEKHLDEWSKNYNVILGGETLWLQNIKQ